MKCPACLAFGVENDAVSTVQGTLYCSQHAVEALRVSVDPRGIRGPMRGGPANMAPMSQFTPPPQFAQETTPPAPPATPTES